MPIPQKPKQTQLEYALSLPCDCHPQNIGP